MIKKSVVLGVVAAALAVSTAFAQAPQGVRLRGTIEKVDGTTVTAKSDKGAPLTLHLADKLKVVEVAKASVTEIKDGDYIGSGAMPQPDGTQKAVEVHIFAESMRGVGDGFKPWEGAPNGTMTNGTVGAAVTNVSGPVITIKYKDGEKKIVVGPDVPIVRYIVSDQSAVKPGAKFAALGAVKQPDGSFNVGRINVGRDGLAPR